MKRDFFFTQDTQIDHCCRHIRFIEIHFYITTINGRKEMLRNCYESLQKFNTRHLKLRKKYVYYMYILQNSSPVFPI